MLIYVRPTKLNARKHKSHVMKVPNLIVFAATLLIAIQLACGEKVDYPGEPEEKSTHILTGTVTAIYSKITRDASNETMHGIAEVRVESVEKGEGMKSGQVVYVRFWHHLKWLGKGNPTPGPSGHQNIPSEGQKVKICVVRSADGSHDVFYVGGFKPAETKRP